jgi:uncharacterized membrane protein
VTIPLREDLMLRTFVGGIAISLLLSMAISVEAQDQQEDTTNALGQAPTAKAPKQVLPPKLPDMLCFGEGPRWSMQFVSWGARYLGINQPDQDFLGGFFWVADRKVWVWQQKNNLGTMGGGYSLSATIQRASCTDPERKGTFPYAAQVNLPQGDMVSGCCRKLKAGEAPVGPHGVPSNKTPPQ